MSRSDFGTGFPLQDLPAFTQAGGNDHSETLPYFHALGVSQSDMPTLGRLRSRGVRLRRERASGSFQVLVAEVNVVVAYPDHFL